MGPHGKWGSFQQRRCLFKQTHLSWHVLLPHASEKGLASLMISLRCWPSPCPEGPGPVAALKRRVGCQSLKAPWGADSAWCFCKVLPAVTCLPLLPELAPALWVGAGWSGSGRDAEGCGKQVVQGRPKPWSLVPAAELHCSGPDHERPWEPVA